MVEQPPVTPDAHLDRLLIPTDISEPWYKSMVRGIRELVNPPKLPPLEVTSRPAEDADLGDLEKIEVPWYKSLVINIRDLINPPKLPPLEISSKPVEVRSIWGAYRGGEGRSGLISLIVHGCVLALMLVVLKPYVAPAKKKDLGPIVYLPEWKPKLPPAAEKAGGGGGGGQKAPTPVTKGAPPKFALKQFQPPAPAVVQPKLPAVPTITAPVPQIQADNYGDPNALDKIFSGGQGTNGLGSGTGGGIGPGSGNGYGPGTGGGIGGGAYRPGGDVSTPVLINKVEPEYSEEARKAKYSGSVLLQIIVDVNGIPRDIKVIRPLGLGLDEKAVEAVSHWRFRPGLKGGKPVPVQANIEVSFRLL